MGFEGECIAIVYFGLLGTIRRKSSFGKKERRGTLMDFDTKKKKIIIQYNLVFAPNILDTQANNQK